jgi:Calcium-binding EGF domain.
MNALLGTNQCSPLASCSITVGSYDCACPPGYSGTGRTCNDIDECADPLLNDCDVNADCINESEYYCIYKKSYL